jgi:hypothetical protein
MKSEGKTDDTNKRYFEGLGIDGRILEWILEILDPRS